MLKDTKKKPKDDDPIPSELGKPVGSKNILKGNSINDYVKYIIKIPNLPKVISDMDDSMGHISLFNSFNKILLEYLATHTVPGDFSRNQISLYIHKYIHFNIYSQYINFFR